MRSPRFEELETRLLLAGGEIHGLVYEDLIGNGVRESEDPGAERAVFLDANLDGLPSDSEPVLTTESDGTFRFLDLEEGNYRVLLVPDSNSISTSQVQLIEIRKLTDNLGNEFWTTHTGVELGFFATFAIEGKVYLDIEGNGSLGAADRELSDKIVHLASVRTDGSTIEKTTVSSEDGGFKFTGLGPGIHIVRQEPLNGFQLTEPPNGSGERPKSANDAPTPESAQTLVNNGHGSNRVDLVFVGDGFTEADLATYRSNVDSIVAGFFAQEPFAEYASYFNVHRVDVSSKDSGVDNDPAGVQRDTALDSGYNCSGQNICIDVSEALSQAANAPDVDQVIALVNSSRYGGTGFINSDLAVIPGHATQSTNLALHEFGHSFGNLADEYVVNNIEFDGPEPEWANLTTFDPEEMTARQTKWYRWLDHPEIATFEGGDRNFSRGIFRPSADSKMRSIGRGFDAVSTEQLVFAIYEVVNPIDDASPPGVYHGHHQFFVDPVDPSGRMLDVEWFIDSDLITGASAPLFESQSTGLPDGVYTVMAKVRDNTPLVRDEQFRDQKMTETRQWTLVLHPDPIYEFQAISGHHVDTSFGNLDTIPPVFTDPLVGVSEEATSPNGAIVGFDLPASVDNSGFEPAVACNPHAHRLFAIGRTTVSCAANDETGNQTTDSFEVIVQDTQPPQIADIAKQYAVENELFEFQIHASDAATDSRDIRFELAGESVSGVSLDPTDGRFSWNVREDQGARSYRFEVVATDGSGLTASATFEIAVRQQLPSQASLAHRLQQIDDAQFQYRAPRTGILTIQLSRDTPAILGIVDNQSGQILDSADQRLDLQVDANETILVSVRSDAPVSGNLQFTNIISPIENRTLRIVATGADESVAFDQFMNLTYRASDTALETVYSQPLRGEVYDSILLYLLGGDDSATIHPRLTVSATVHGGAGEDSIQSGAGNDQLFGGSGNDLIDGGGGSDQLRGQSGDDHLQGGRGSDILYGGGQRDLLIGQEGHDELFGGADPDSLIGSKGNDSLRGQAGADELTGGAGNDVLSAGSDKDRYHFGAGRLGSDRITDASGGVLDFTQSKLGISISLLSVVEQRVHRMLAILLAGRHGITEVVGSHNADTIVGDNRANRLHGNGGNDLLVGLRGPDYLSADAGRDTLRGGQGDDSLFGGDQRDFLMGEKGRDLLWGGHPIMKDKPTEDSFSDKLNGGKGLDSTFASRSDQDFLKDIERLLPMP